MALYSSLCHGNKQVNNSWENKKMSFSQLQWILEKCVDIKFLPPSLYRRFFFLKKKVHNDLFGSATLTIEEEEKKKKSTLF